MPAGAILLGNERIEVRDYERRPSLQRAPQGIRHAARLIDALTMEPRDGYSADMAVFLGFRLARSDLDTAQNIAATDDAAEDSLAHRAAGRVWRRGRRATGDGKKRNALSRSVGLRRPARAHPTIGRSLAPRYRRLHAGFGSRSRAQRERDSAEDTEEQAGVTERDIQEMLREVQRLSEQGRTQEAQQLLSMLANILNNMDAQLSEAKAVKAAKKASRIRKCSRAWISSPKPSASSVS